MRRLLIAAALCFVSVVASAQFCANTLIVESADTARFILRVGGSLINKEPATKVTVPNIYAQEVNIVVVFVDKNLAPLVAQNVPVVAKLKKKDNVPPQPYKAKYIVAAKKKHSKLKCKFITTKI